MSEWIKSKQYPLYEVNVDGDVREIATKEIVNPRKDQSGRRYVQLKEEGKDKKTLVSLARVVYAAWYDEDISDYVIKHRDGKHANNAVDNLYLCFKNGRPVNHEETNFVRDGTTYYQKR